MTRSEFSNEFDVLYNSITSNKAPGLDEYEKSVFLTKAQDDVLKSYFDPRTNKPQQGFDGSEIRQIDFSMVTAVKDYDSFSSPVFDPRSNNKSVQLEPTILMPINEQVTVERDGDTEYLQVIPITYDEYRRLMSKPYKRPLKYQAWRLFNTSSNNNSADIIIGPGDTLIKYSMRYIRRPRAIILSKLEGVTLDDGKSEPQDCELDPILHHEILQRAVEFAKASYVGDLQSQVALGSASQTNIGIVPQSR